MTADLGRGEIDRTEILRRFEALLDSALASEAPPPGIDAEILASVMASGDDDSDDRNCDSYALWSAMTALTQEIKLQGRAFQDLNRALSDAGREDRRGTARGVRRARTERCSARPNGAAAGRS